MNYCYKCDQFIGSMADHIKECPADKKTKDQSIVIRAKDGTEIDLTELKATLQRGYTDNRQCIAAIDALVAALSVPPPMDHDPTEFAIGRNFHRDLVRQAAGVVEG